MKKSANKSTNDAIKVIKAGVLGPGVAILGITVAYFVWWGISKLFYVLHSVVIGNLIPWLSESWVMLIVIWVLIALTTTLYYVTEQQKKKKKEKNVDSSSLTASEKINELVEAFYEEDEADLAKIFDAKRDSAKT